MVLWNAPCVCGDRVVVCGITRQRQASGRTVTGTIVCAWASTGALERGKVDPAKVDEVFLGCVITANLGQVRLHVVRCRHCWGCGHTARTASTSGRACQLAWMGEGAGVQARLQHTVQHTMQLVGSHLALGRSPTRGAGGA